MKWLIGLMLIILLFFIGFMAVLSIGWRVINFIMSAVRHILKMPDDRRTISRGRKIVDVTAEPVEDIPVPEKEISQQEKEQLATMALSRAFASAGKDIGNFNEEFESISNLLPQIKNRAVRQDFVEVLKALKSTKAVFDRDTERYKYTKTLLAKSISGLDIILNDAATDEKFIIGMKYAARYIKDYIIDLSVLGNVANSIDNATLSDEITLMLDKMERFYWLKIAYPEIAIKNETLIKTMVPSVTHKLQMCLNMNNYELGNKETADLLDTAIVTVKEMNVAVGNVLENALSWDVIQADAALDTIRRELRLRGMY